MIVVVENMWDRFPDAGPPALTEMKVSSIPMIYQMRLLTTSTLELAM
jgi:hypothetical protein